MECRLQAAPGRAVVSPVAGDCLPAVVSGTAPTVSPSRPAGRQSRGCETEVQRGDLGRQVGAGRPTPWSRYLRPVSTGWWSLSRSSTFQVLDTSIRLPSSDLGVSPRSTGSASAVKPVGALSITSSQNHRPSSSRSLSGTSRSSQGMRPAQLVFEIGTAFPSWPGRPTPCGIHPVKWLLSERPDSFKLDRLPSSAGISPLNSFPWSPSDCQVGEVAQLRRDRTAQLVLVEVQPLQVGQVAQLPRYRPAQLVLVELQPDQLGQVAQRGRYPPGQLGVS